LLVIPIGCEAASCTGALIVFAEPLPLMPWVSANALPPIV